MTDTVCSSNIDASDTRVRKVLDTRMSVFQALIRTEEDLHPQHLQPARKYPLERYMIQAVNLERRSG